jgi:hypothetical protein
VSLFTGDTQAETRTKRRVKMKNEKGIKRDELGYIEMPAVTDKYERLLNRKELDYLNATADETKAIIYKKEKDNRFSHYAYRLLTHQYHRSIIAYNLSQLKKWLEFQRANRSK